MLIDTQLLSMVHRPLQEACIPKLKEIFLITWSCRAYPSIGVVNLRCRQRSAYTRNENETTKIANIHGIVVITSKITSRYDSFNLLKK